MKVYNILQKIKNTLSMNEKTKILKDNIDNNILKLVLYTVKDTSITFGIKSLDFLDNIDSFEEYNSDEPLLLAINDLTPLINRALTKMSGNKAKEYLTEVFSMLNKEHQEILKLVIEKDLKAGISTSIINKVFPGLIYKPQYMGCAPYKPEYAKKLIDSSVKKYEFAISEIKYDGRFMNGLYSKELGVKAESRNGKISDIVNLKGESIFSKLFVEVYKIYKEDFVLTGELLLRDTPNRHKANGIVASIIKISEKILLDKDVSKELVKFKKEHSIDYEHAIKKVQYIVWDIIPLELYYTGKYSLQRYLRLKILEKMTKELKEKQRLQLRCCEYKKIKSYDEAIEHYVECISKGEEGTVLKGANSIWENGKDWKLQIKIKPTMTSDLIVKGFSYGNKGTKYEDSINVLLCESLDGKVKCRASGLKEKDMKTCMELNSTEDLLNSIVEVKSNGLSRTDDSYSLLSPVFTQFRDDKNNPETLSDVENNWNMVLGLKK